jgi:hypothetical protein
MCKIDEDIAINETPRLSEYTCDCWETREGDTLWLGPEHFLPGMFAAMPDSLRPGTRMRICKKTGRLAHILMANGEVGIDVPLLTDDPTGGPCAVFVQHGYCYRCDKYEWMRLSKYVPASPIFWMTCRAPALL